MRDVVTEIILKDKQDVHKPRAEGNSVMYEYVKELINLPLLETVAGTWDTRTKWTEWLISIQ